MFNKRKKRKIARAIANAHWIERTHLFRRDEYICSACGKISDKAYTACPYCGIRQNKVKNASSWVDEIEAVSALFED